MFVETSLKTSVSRGRYVTARHLNFTSFLRDGPAYRTRRQVLFPSFVQCCASLIVSQTHDLICQATSWLCTLAGSVFAITTHLFFNAIARRQLSFYNVSSDTFCMIAKRKLFFYDLRLPNPQLIFVQLTPLYC